jgi:hypothetical protein
MLIAAEPATLTAAARISLRWSCDGCYHHFETHPDPVACGNDAFAA